MESVSAVILTAEFLQQEIVFYWLNFFFFSSGAGMLSGVGEFLKKQPKDLLFQVKLRCKVHGYACNGHNVIGILVAICCITATKQYITVMASLLNTNALLTLTSNVSCPDTL